MSIFKRTIKKDDPVVSVSKVPVAKTLRVKSGNENSVPAKIISEVAPFRKVTLICPRVTEKASFLIEKSNVYVFNVAVDAVSRNIALAVKELYKVTPRKVSIVTIPKKVIFVRGKKGLTGGGKKAYVYLNKGDKIEVV